MMSFLWRRIRGREGVSDKALSPKRGKRSVIKKQFFRNRKNEARSKTGRSHFCDFSIAFPIPVREEGARKGSRSEIKYCPLGHKRDTAPFRGEGKKEGGLEIWGVARSVVSRDKEGEKKGGTTSVQRNNGVPTTRKEVRRKGKSPAGKSLNRSAWRGEKKNENPNAGGKIM